MMYEVEDEWLSKNAYLTIERGKLFTFMHDYWLQIIDKLNQAKNPHDVICFVKIADVKIP